MRAGDPAKSYRTPSSLLVLEFAEAHRFSSPATACGEVSGHEMLGPPAHPVAGRPAWPPARRGCGPLLESLKLPTRNFEVRHDRTALVLGSHGFLLHSRGGLAIDQVCRFLGYEPKGLDGAPGPHSRERQEFGSQSYWGGRVSGRRASLEGTLGWNAIETPLASQSEICPANKVRVPTVSPLRVPPAALPTTPPRSGASASPQ
jgi:hypothetical protein